MELSRRQLRTLHLFAGAGGGILADLILGHLPVCAVEIDPYCRRILLSRQRDGGLPRFPIWDDVRTFDGRPWEGAVDIVSGGFPCTDISAAGRGAGRNSRVGHGADVKFTVVPVAPIGSHETVAHVNRGHLGSGFEVIAVDDYPPHPRGDALRAARVDVSLGLRDAAKILGVTPVDLSAVEHGRASFASDAEWDRALAMIQMGCGYDPADRTGGGHDPKCPGFEPECTCYELTGGHQPMCPAGVALAKRRKRGGV